MTVVATEIYPSQILHENISSQQMLVLLVVLIMAAMSASFLW